MLVRDWMSVPVRTMPPHISAGEALAIMDLGGFRRAPILEDGAIVGIITRSDLHGVVGRVGGARVPVSEIMTRSVATVAPDDTLENAAQLMMRRKVSGLPVVSKRRLVGIITESDVFRALCTILGVEEKGARVSFSMADDGNLLDEVRRYSKGLAIRTLVTMHDPDKRRWTVTLRLRGRGR